MIVVVSYVSFDFIWIGFVLKLIAFHFDFVSQFVGTLERICHSNLQSFCGANEA